ncbi:probable G-protein coupled receptor 139 [Narcine bancroftii]|uniref:probable G-protein coupled receptor 139 n=1 Tax=Narcine bancroftii TaxID=1343680 RepID=UPI003831481C
MVFQIRFVSVTVLSKWGAHLNLVAIIILSRGKCGLTKCITRYLVVMAGADLMVVVVCVVMEQINNIYNFLKLLLITPVCSVVLVLKIATMDFSVWLTVAFTFDRHVAICYQNLRKRYCTQETANVVIVTVGAVGGLRSIPAYFVVEPYAIIDGVPWRCVQKPEFFTSPLWKAYELFDSIMTPLLPICFILLFNALTARHIIAANRVRRGLRNNSEHQKDPEVEIRRKSIILLFALSANFVLLWMLYVIHSMNWQVENYFYTDKYFNTPKYIAQQFGFMLQVLSTCTNTCIYGLTQRKFREQLKNGVRYMATLNGHIC